MVSSSRSGMPTQHILDPVTRCQAKQRMAGADVPGRWHPYGRTREEDLALLAAGQPTGWEDAQGRAAPWPQDFLDPDVGWFHNGYTADDYLDGLVPAPKPEPDLGALFNNGTVDDPPF